MTTRNDVLKILDDYGTIDADDIAHKFGLPLTEVQSTLAELVAEGVVLRHGKDVTLPGRLEEW